MIVDPSVVAFNAAEGWSQDVSVQYRRRLRQRCDLQLPDIPDRPYPCLGAPCGLGLALGPRHALDDGVSPFQLLKWAAPLTRGPACYKLGVGPRRDTQVRPGLEPSNPPNPAAPGGGSRLQENRTAAPGGPMGFRNYSTINRQDLTRDCLRDLRMWPGWETVDGVTVPGVVPPSQHHHDHRPRPKHRSRSRNWLGQQRLHPAQAQSKPGTSG
jgi:hypothetical protein